MEMVVATIALFVPKGKRIELTTAGQNKNKLFTLVPASFCLANSSQALAANKWTSITPV